MKKQSLSNKILLCVTALALALSLTTTFAWFSSRFITDPFSFTTAKLASTVKLYEALDFDLDGYPDVEITTSTETDDQGNTTTTSTEQVKYEELYNNANKIVGDDTIEYTALIISSMLPSECYTYKLEVANNGTVKTEMVAAFVIDKDNIPTNNAALFVNYLYTLAATPVWINQDGTVIEGEQLRFSQLITNALSETPDTLLTVSQATALMTSTSFDSITLNILDTAIFYNLVKDYDINANDFTANDTMIEVGKERSFMFRLEMLPYQEVSALIDQTTYQQLKGLSYEIILSVALEADELG